MNFKWRTFLRILAGIGFVVAGANHFVHSDFYCRIVPPGFPAPLLLVQISGFCEIAGGVGICIPFLRRAAGWGLIALLIAVFPANVYMAIHPEHFAALHISNWMLWLRLPVQGVLIAWVWLVSVREQESLPPTKQRR